MRFVLTLTIENTMLDGPVHTQHTLEGKSKADVLKFLSIPTHQVCELKNSGKSVWTDHNNSVHTLELKEE